MLLSTPRFGAAIPNSAGTLVLHTVLTYSFESHSWSNEIRVIDVDMGKGSVVINDERASEPNWIGDEDLLVYLNNEKDGKMSLAVCDAKDLSR